MVGISNIAPELAMLKKMNSNAAATNEPSSGRRTRFRVHSRFGVNGARWSRNTSASLSEPLAANGQSNW